MHMRGNPRTMQEAPIYKDVVGEIGDFFQERLEALTSAGISPERIVWDPGIGFGKTLEHNLTLLRSLEQLRVGGRPVLIGLSRKSFISALLGQTAMEKRDVPTVALTAWCARHGADIHRVHQIRPNVQALRMVEALEGSALSG